MNKIAIAAALGFALALSGAVGANAAPQPSVSTFVSPNSQCSGSRTYYTVKSTGSTFQQAAGANSAVTGSTGVRLSISTSTTFEVSGSVTSSSSITVSAGVAAIQAQVGVTVGVKKSGTTSTGGSWTVPANYKIGKLQIGALKYQGTISKYLENSACVSVLQASTAYNAPAQNWHFQTSKVS